MRVSQKGFSNVEILLVVLLVTVVGFGIYNIRNTNNKATSVNTPSAPQRTTDPASGQVATNTIELVTGTYIPADILIKKGETVTWAINDLTEANYGIENNADSTEKFSSDTLKTGDQFKHTFKKVGTFGWHDKFNGNLSGTVTVTD